MLEALQETVLLASVIAVSLFYLVKAALEGRAAAQAAREARYEANRAALKHAIAIYFRSEPPKRKNDWYYVEGDDEQTWQD